MFSGGGVLPIRRSHSELERPKVGRIPEEDGFSGGVSESIAISGGLKGVMFSGESAGDVLPAAPEPAADVVRRVPQLLHEDASDEFIVPQMGQRISLVG